MTVKGSDRDYKLVFHAPAVLEEAIAAWCWDRGGEYAVDIPASGGPDDPVRFSLFPGHGTAPETVTGSLGTYLFAWSRETGIPVDIPRFNVRPVRNDWARMWKRFFRGRDIGHRFRIAPPWESTECGDRLLLSIDPGASFGTGHHPTTVLCIEYLETLDLEEKDVLDAGCGSGVLSLAALLLGARHADGFDNDPEAVATASANAERNRLTEGAAFLTGSEETIAGKAYDVILCNMLPRYALPMLPALFETLRTGGVFFLSGIEEGQIGHVRDGLEAVSFYCGQTFRRDGWMGCHVKNS